VCGLLGVEKFAAELKPSSLCAPSHSQTGALTAIKSGMNSGRNRYLRTAKGHEG